MKNVLSILAVIIAVCLLVGCGGGQTTTTSNYAIPSPLYEGNFSSSAWTEEEKIMIVSRINEIRAAGLTCGETHMPPVGEVVWYDELEESAFHKGFDLVESEFFAHEGSKDPRYDRAYRVNGLPFSPLINETTGGRFPNKGENLAGGQEDIYEAIDGWIKSETHCKGLMNGRYTHMGISYQEGGEYQRYFIQHLAGE